MTCLTKQIIHLSTKETRITWLTSCFMNLIKYSFWCSCMALAWLLHGSCCTCLIFHTQSTQSAAPHVGIQPTGLWVTYWNLCKKPCKKKSPIVSASHRSDPFVLLCEIWRLTAGQRLAFPPFPNSSILPCLNSSSLWFFTIILHCLNSSFVFSFTLEDFDCLPGVRAAH